jgi:uncharacterized protein GlcG (DUF336 family)
MSHSITLDQANKVIAAAFAKGKELNLKPLSVVVVDAGGHIQAFQRQDGASTLRLAIALGKAAGGLSLGVSSRKLGEMAVERPTFIAAAANVSQNGMIPAAGGINIKGVDGTLIGAVGVTGDTSDNDEICALVGIAAAELTAQ